MNRKAKRFSVLLPLGAVFFAGQIFVHAQNVVTSSDIQSEAAVFVLKQPKKFFNNAVSVKKNQQTNASGAKTARSARSNSQNKAKDQNVVVEPIAPEDWVNEEADNAIEERKTSDSEPFLSLSSGYLNSRAYFCETPQFPLAAQKARKKLVNSKVLVTVGKYGGILQARTIEGDDIFRSSVYKTLGSMSFRQSYFMGKPVRIEGVLSFTQNPANSVLCRESSQELEVPAVIDGGVLNEMATTCELPEFPAEAKTEGLKTVEAKIQVIVDEQGKVIEAKAIGGNASFTDSAVKSAMKATFPKSMIAGKPVKVRGILVFNQNLNNDIRCGSVKAS